MHIGTGPFFTFQACVGAGSPPLVVSGRAVGRTVDLVVVIVVVIGLLVVESVVVLGAGKDSVPIEIKGKKIDQIHLFVQEKPSLLVDFHHSLSDTSNSPAEPCSPHYPHPDPTSLQ